MLNSFEFSYSKIPVTCTVKDHQNYRLSLCTKRLQEAIED